MHKIENPDTLCSTITKKGSHCKNKIKRASDSHHCHVHQRIRCIAINKNGKRCSNFVKIGTSCFIHKDHNSNDHGSNDSIKEYSSPTDDGINDFVNLESLFEENKNNEVSEGVDVMIHDISEEDDEILLSTILYGEPQEPPDDDNVIAYKTKSCSVCSGFNVENLCLENKCINVFDRQIDFKDVSVDGNCFWRALSNSIYRTELYFDHFKKKCMNLKKKDEFISSKFVEFYEVPVISKYLKKTIHIYLALEDKLCVYTCHPNGSIENICPEKILHANVADSFDIHLCYTSNHYKNIIF